MAIRIVRLGSPRLPGEGVRIGTVRRPPRGVPKSDFASADWYDVWFPNLAPSDETLRLGKGAASAQQWSIFAKKYRVEMATPHIERAIILLATLSHQSHFSVGCYCAEESRCHRSILRELLLIRGARVE